MFMKEYEITLCFKFMSLREIVTQLTASKYKDRFFMLKTDIPNVPKLIRPSDDFENKLVEKGIKYFAYIKFFKDNSELYGIVAGKTGSALVNNHSDVCFSTKITDGFSRRFLDKKNMEWYKEEILIIEPEKTEDEKENKKEALAIERDIKKMFNLLGS